MNKWLQAFTQPTFCYRLAMVDTDDRVVYITRVRDVGQTDERVVFWGEDIVCDAADLIKSMWLLDPSYRIVSKQDYPAVFPAGVSDILKVTYTMNLNV